ncbi:ABC transporter permease [Paraburkholderia terricola]|uniref:D-xylose transport system permease protein n=1 Tax=Paraburkholderia terricola TaxID=169427 RepID=A0A1M6T4D8_9BURK|nr:MULTISPECIES: ABC transporter permease [Paraburkholderia]SDO70349.1 D-xylose transport system permease protein [Paraburkholderia sediminicola]SHK51648.1 D-xylose transport system permease protein [Paraburkholderia terricola]
MNLSTSKDQPVQSFDAASGQPAVNRTGGAGAQPPSMPLRRLLGVREMGVYYALIFLVLILSAITAYTGQANYLSVNNITNVLYQSSLVAMIAVAMTVILITGNFDLSVASVAALSAAVMVTAADAVGFWPAAFLGVFVAMLVGVLNGAIVQYLGINAFIVTLGTLTAIRGVVQIVTDGRSLTVSDSDALSAMQTFEAGRVHIALTLLVLGIALVARGLLVASRARRAGRGMTSSVFTIVGGLCLIAMPALGGSELTVQKPVVYMAAFTAVVWFVLTFTTTGRRIYAVGGNPEAARLSGINVKRYKMAAFILCSGVAGVGGVLFGSRLGAINPTAMQGQELAVIASAILGGTSLYGGSGSVIKTLAGTLLLVTLANGFNILNLGANYQGLIEGTVIIIAAAIYTVGGSRRGGKSH